MTRVLLILFTLWSNITLAEHLLQYGEIIAVRTAGSADKFLGESGAAPKDPTQKPPYARQRFTIIHPIPGYRAATPAETCPICPAYPSCPPSYQPYYPPEPVQPIKFPLFSVVEPPSVVASSSAALRFGDSIALQDYKNRFLGIDPHSESVLLASNLTATEIWHVIDPSNDKSFGKPVEVGAPFALLSSRGSYLSDRDSAIYVVERIGSPEQWTFTGPIPSFE